MLDFLYNAGTINREIPVDRLFEPEVLEQYWISDVTLHMSINPDNRNVTAHIDDRVRMEEIEVFSVHFYMMPDMGAYKRFLKQVHSKVRYPCVVFFEYLDKFRVTAWNFRESTSQSNKNVLESLYLSAWMREPATSVKAKKCIDTIKDLLLNGEGDIQNLYNRICQAIMICTPQYIGSREHLDRVVYNLTGRKHHPIINSIECGRRYDVTNSSNKYNKRYRSSYTYTYEYEDVWHAFMKDDSIRSIIEKRRFVDMDDLMLHVG